MNKKIIKIFIEPIKKKKCYNINKIIKKISSDSYKKYEVLVIPMGKEIW